jgi:uncharacterized membrane protein YdjX (TVP38/TMEM64 family)
MRIGMHIAMSERRIWLLIVAVVAVVALRFSGLSHYLSLETLRLHRRELTSFVADHYALSVLAYMGIYILAVALCFPGALVLTLTGGFLFGALAGSVFTVIAATAGAVLVFLFARSILGANALDRFGAPAARLAANIRKNAWSYLLVLRLVPLFPFFLVNLIPAFAGVGLRTYVPTTFFGIIPATAVYSLSGAGLGDILDKGTDISARSILTPQILAALCGLAVLSLAAIPLRRRFGDEKTGP